jgi:hypothetical protein
MSISSVMIVPAGTNVAARMTGMPGAENRTINVTPTVLTTIKINPTIEARSIAFGPNNWKTGYWTKTGLVRTL